MPYPGIRFSTTALLLISGCATPNIFTASQGAKPNAEQAAPSGPRPSSYTSSWSGNQNAKRPPQDPGNAVGNPVVDNERRIQDLLAAGDRSQNAGDRRAARSAFEQALRLAPGDARANYQLAIMDDEDGRFADAETHYLNVIRQTPNDPNILSSLGWSYFLQARYEESDRTLREALRFDPNNKFALNNLGMLYGTRGDYDGALTIFRMAGSEADAQRALAILKQNAGNVHVSAEQYAPNPPVNPASPAGGGVAGNPPDARNGIGIGETDATSPQGRKLIADFNRLKAESARQQQESRARVAQKNMSAPSPWNNNRQAEANSGQRDAGRANAVQGLVWENDATSGIPPFKGGPAVPAQINGQLPRNDAAFPGDAPAQANRARQAGPADLGSSESATGSIGNIPPFKAGSQSYPGTQTIYEQPAAPPTGGQSRSPVITPAGEAPASRGGNAPTWNSLPRDDSYRGNSNGGNVAPVPGRLSDWPRNTRNPVGAQDQTSGTNVGQFNGAQQQGSNSQQEAQAAAAQLGLSAGSGGLGFPAPDWPASVNGQTANPANGSGAASGFGASGGDNFPGSQGPANNQFVPGNQNPQLNQNQAGQSSPGNQSTSNGSGSTLPPWSGRPMSGATVPQAVVPSAQGVVYGSTGDSGLPNFYSARPTISPAR